MSLQQVKDCLQIAVIENNIVAVYRFVNELYKHGVDVKFSKSALNNTDKLYYTDGDQ